MLNQISLVVSLHISVALTLQGVFVGVSHPIAGSQISQCWGAITLLGNDLPHAHYLWYLDRKNVAFLSCCWGKNRFGGKRMGPYFVIILCFWLVDGFINLTVCLFVRWFVCSFVCLRLVLYHADPKRSGHYQMWLNATYRDRVVLYNNSMTLPQANLHSIKNLGRWVSKTALWGWSTLFFWAKGCKSFWGMIQPVPKEVIALGFRAGVQSVSDTTLDDCR